VSRLGQLARKYRQGAHQTVLATEIKLFLLATLLYIADIETLDRSASHLKDMRHQFVGQEIALEVTHDLMNFDNNLPLAVGRDLEGLDIRIDDLPLTFPIAAHPITSVHVATFHSICPNDIGLNGRENALDVAAIEEGIDSSEEFHVIGHSNSILPFHLRRLSNRLGARITLLTMTEGFMPSVSRKLSDLRREDRADK
jgi:hypothetical protein